MLQKLKKQGMRQEMTLSSFATVQMYLVVNYYWRVVTDKCILWKLIKSLLLWLGSIAIVFI